MEHVAKPHENKRFNSSNPMNPSKLTKETIKNSVYPPNFQNARDFHEMHLGDSHQNSEEDSNSPGSKPRTR